MEKIRFEVCANSLQSALAAQKGGADRIELCSQLKVGGVTPSAATIKMTIERLRIPVFILIRPRSGDFFYDDFDMSVILLMLLKLIPNYQILIIHLDADL